MARNASLTIVEAENIVEVGELDPNEVQLPGIYVDRIVPATEPSKVEILKTRAPDGEDETASKSGKQALREVRARGSGGRVLCSRFWAVRSLRRCFSGWRACSWSRKCRLCSGC